MRLTVYDKVSFKITQRQMTDEGFMRVPGRVARTGIQDYLACELGLPGDPNRIVKVNRSADEVFNTDSLASYNGVDVTIEHPSNFVDAKSYSALSKGTVLNAVQDGDFVKAELIVKSQDAIDAINEGKAQLSAGYSAEYVKAADGCSYEYEQKDIRINHVALVDRARAGAQARIFDHKPEITMIKIALDSGRSVEIEDGATATLINDTIERLTKRATDAEAEAAKAKATADSVSEKLTKAETELKKATDSGSIKSKIAEISKVMDTARKIAGKDFTCDSIDLIDIKRAAMAKVNDSIDWPTKDDAYVCARFDIADEDTAKKDDEDEDEKKKDKMSDSARQLAKDAAAHQKFTDNAYARRNWIDSQKYLVTTGQLTEAQLNERANEMFGGNK